MSDMGDTANKDSLKWSNEECKKIADRDFFPLALRHDVILEKRVITRFLHFYLGGRRDKGFSVEDIVFPILAIMPITLAFTPLNETYVWDSKEFRKDGTLFFLSPEDRLATDVKIIMNKTIEQKDEDKSASDVPVQAPDTIQMFDSQRQSLTIADDVMRAEELEFDSEFTLADMTVSDQDGDESHSNLQADSVDIGQYMTSDTPAIVKKENKVVQYGPVDNSAFVTFCNKSLNEWSSNQGSRTALKAFFAVVALVLMRATTKGYKHLVTTFHGEKFHSFIRHMSNAGLKYCPPHKRCLKSAFRTFSRKDKGIPIMFAKLVILAESTSLEHGLVIKRSLLNYTADYGFNLVALLRSIQNSLSAGENINRIVSLTTSDETRTSWETLHEFVRKYKNPLWKHLELKYYRWARILDSRYFRELSCQANYPLAVLLGVFAEKVTGNQTIWNSTWVKNDDEEERLKLMGVQMYEHFISVSTRFTKVYKLL